MALQFSYDSQYGVLFSTAYARIVETHVSTPLMDVKNRLSVRVEVFATNQSRLDGMNPVGYLEVSGSFDETSSLSKTDLYAWLKTQPEFEGALDV